MTIDEHAEALVGMALKQLSDAHTAADAQGDRDMFAALLQAWLGWAGEMHCTGCTLAVIDRAEDALKEARRRVILH